MVAKSISIVSASLYSHQTMVISIEELNCLMHLQDMARASHASHHGSTFGSGTSLGLQLHLGLLTQGHLPICQVPNLFSLIYTIYIIPQVLVLLMAMLVLLWDRV